MIRKPSEFSHPDPNSQKEILFVPKMKMKEKSKLKTIEEIPLVELESQIRDEGELSFDSSLFICSQSYATYHMLDMISHTFSLFSFDSIRVNYSRMVVPNDTND